jgi:DNA-binding LytR/AlgR family response regulator
MFLMKIAICDDEPLCVRQLAGLLYKLLPNASIKKYPDGRDILSDDACHLYDIVFLDVSMPVMDGFETAKHLRLLNDRQILVFATTLEDQMSRGFDFDATDYIVKPVTQERLSRLLERIQKKLNRTRPPDVEIKTVTNETVLVSPADIRFFEYATGHRIQVATNNKTHEYIGRLDDVEKQYAPLGFIRIHRAVVVNMAYIWIIENDTVTLTNGSKIPVSRSRLQQLKERYREYRRETNYA